MSLTAHFFAGDTDKLWKTVVNPPPHTGVPANGDLVEAWQDEATPATRDLMWRYGNLPATTAPTFADPGSMLLPSLVFDGTSDFLRLLSNTESSKYTSDLLAAGGKTIIAALRMTATATNNANMYYNTSLVADAGGYVGIHFKTISGTTYIYGYNWDGNADSTTGIALTLNTDYVVMLRHDGVNLRLSLLSGDGGATRVDESTASGNTTNVGALVYLANTNLNGVLWGGILGEMYFDNTDLGSTNTPLTDIVGRWLPAASGGVHVSTLLAHRFSGLLGA